MRGSCWKRASHIDVAVVVSKMQALEGQPECEEPEEVEESGERGEGTGGRVRHQGWEVEASGGCHGRRDARWFGF